MRFEFTLLLTFSLAVCRVRPENSGNGNYPPGYLANLNSTIANLMTQLKVYQQYIDQAFKPLDSYDKVFPKTLDQVKSDSVTSAPPREEPVPVIIPAQEVEKDSIKTRFDNAGTQKNSNVHKTKYPESEELEGTEDVVLIDEPVTDKSLLTRNFAHGTKSGPESLVFSPDNYYRSTGEKLVLPIDTRQEEPAKDKKESTKPHSGQHIRLESQECGVFNPSSVRAKDSGGHITWPWSVKLGKAVGNGFLYKCGGTFITNIHILTSAHCVTHANEIDTVHHLGRKVKLAQIITHPDYRNGRGYNDIAIVLLTKPLPVPNNETALMPVCSHFTALLKSSLERVNAFSWTTEWKFSNKDRKLEIVLRNLYTKILDNKLCDAKFRAELGSDFIDVFPDGLDSSIICAKSSRTSICQKSAGNALLTRDPSTRTYILGVVVKGETSCGEDGNQGHPMELPAIFTRVSYFQDWIRQVVDNAE